MSIALTGVLQVTVSLAGVIDTFVAGIGGSLDFSDDDNSFYLGVV